MKALLVSIIIPLYNRELLIISTLRSILKQTYENWECIIVDDGSTDNSFTVVEKFIEIDKRFILVKRLEDYKKGGNGARNYGFKLSKGEFVNWIDSDDTIHQNFILEKIKAFNEDTDVVISKTAFVDNENKVIKKESRTQLTKNLLDDFITLKVSWYVSDPLWKKAFLLEKGVVFNENLLKGQDRDFHIRMLLNKPTIKIIDKYLYFYNTNLYSISALNSTEIAFSILEESIRQNKRVLEYQIHNRTKLFLLKQQLRTYSMLFKMPKIFNLYMKVIKDLFVFDIHNIVVLVKFLICIITFKIFKKGDKILKSM